MSSLPRNKWCRTLWTECAIEMSGGKQREYCHGAFRTHSGTNVTRPFVFDITCGK